jgi:hypothetical protein
MSVLAPSVLWIASTDAMQVDSSAVPAGTMHAYRPGEFTMTVCGQKIDNLHRWELGWTAHPSRNCCSRCVAATPLRHSLEG